MSGLTLVAVGDRMPSWVSGGFEHYAKQINRRIPFRLVEVRGVKRGKGADPGEVQKREEVKILNAIPKHAGAVALDRGGRDYDSMQVADKLREWTGGGRPVAIVMGGPEGLSEEFIGNCDETWSLSRMTLSHTVARLVIAEQLYRALDIVSGGPYHR